MNWFLFSLVIPLYVDCLPTPFDPLPTSANCSVHRIDQDVDHFSFGQSGHQFSQRYFVYEKFLTKQGPIFFYTGNEADVTLFVNNTGFMWELGQSMGALLVFAEHRGYGESVTSIKSVNQVLSDYAHLIVHLYDQLKLPQSTPVITFGSSYGGMLSAWMRTKYPHLVEGALASSAPVFHMFGTKPAPDGAAFATAVTRVAGVGCSSRLRKALQAINRLTSSDPKDIRRKLGLCETPSRDDISLWANQPWGFLAMGSYPFANNYIPMTAGVGSSPLPANPLTDACGVLTRSSDVSDDGLLDSFRDSIQIWYNNTGDRDCFHIDRDRTGDSQFMFLRCADLGGPYRQGTNQDAFAPPMSIGPMELSQMCEHSYGHPARIGEGAVEFGLTKLDTVAGMSNIIWSNGELDPWKEYGVACGSEGVRCPSSVISPVINGGAHSSDMLFSHPLDSENLTNVRRLESAHISSWIEAKLLRYAGVEPQDPFTSSNLPHVVLSD
jgi:lysosomal Pro-X carboxypeptidase